jgi:predicted RNase H-like HicB family nuclease
LIAVSTHHLTAVVEREGDGYVSLCPELDIASQGSSVEEAKANLQEAVQVFLETASPAEARDRMASDPAIIRQSGLPRALFGEE